MKLERSDVSLIIKFIAYLMLLSIWDVNGFAPSAFYIFLVVVTQMLKANVETDE